MKDRMENSPILHTAGDFIKGVMLMTVTLAMLSCLGGVSLYAQQTQIPTLQVCNLSTTGGPGAVFGNESFNISERAGGPFTGNFNVSIEVECDPGSGYPIGSVVISGISMTDSVVQGTISSTTIDQVTIAGKDTPTAWLNGRCTVQADPAGVPPPSGCRYWMMLANNNQNANPGAAAGTPDIVSFLVFDRTGSRIAYGTAPALVGGFLFITPGP